MPLRKPSPKVVVPEPPTAVKHEFVTGSPAVPATAPRLGGAKTQTRSDGRRVRRVCLYLDESVARALGFFCLAQYTDQSSFVTQAVREALERQGAQDLLRPDTPKP